MKESKKAFAIVVMAIGKKYDCMLKSVHRQFERYAKVCNADFIVCSTPPDPTFKRSILSQKMLLPDLYREYERIAFFDLDILIPKNAASIFKSFQLDKGFAAVADPRGTNKFKNMVVNHWHLPEIINETHSSYFLDRGFPPLPANALIQASINGGVFICNPSKVAELFKTAYYSDFLEEARVGGGIINRTATTNEEGLMAYTSQRYNLFFELDEKFNTIVLYELYDDMQSELTELLDNTPRYFKYLNKIHKYVSIPSFLYPRPYRRFVKSKLKSGNILHFGGGGLPFKGLN